MNLGQALTPSCGITSAPQIASECLHCAAGAPAGPTVQLRVSCLRDSPGNREDRAGALCAGLWLEGTASPTWPVGASKSKEHLTDSSPFLAVADACCSLMIRSGDFHVLMDRKPGPGQLNGVQLSQPGCSPVALPLLHPALSLSFLSHQ